MPQGGGEHDFWPLGVEIVPGSKTPYLIDRNLLIDFHKVLYRTLVDYNIRHANGQNTTKAQAANRAVGMATGENDWCLDIPALHGSWPHGAID
jgi:hypothetical protein